MALSTYLPLAESLEREGSAANKDVPIFLVHGTEDPVIPFMMSTTSRDKLLALGYQVEWHEYPMQHSVSIEELADIAAWLRRVLTA
jgi:phospholipase/carboxylesterase